MSSQKNSETKKASKKAGNEDRVVRSFEELVKSKFPFVDKTMFIRDFVELGEQALSICRPRKLGKTINLDMLIKFLDRDNKIKGLFEGLKIKAPEHEQFVTAYENQFPVIYITFASMTENTFQKNFDLFKDIICDLFNDFSYLEKEDMPRKEKFYKIKRKKASRSEYISSIQTLSLILFKFHKKKPFIFFDEIDTPLSSAITHDFYDEMAGTLSIFFQTCLKQNFNFKKALVCSVLPIFTMPPFTNVNNVVSYTVFDEEFSASFGFTRTEVKDLIKAYQEKNILDKGIHVSMKDLTEWFDNLKIGKEDIYSPSSVSACLSENAVLKAYNKDLPGSLVNITQKLLFDKGLLPLLNFQVLTKNMSLKKYVCPSFKLQDIYKEENAMWNYFVHAGVVSLKEVPSSENSFTVSIYMPGKEIQSVLKDKYINVLIREKKLPDYEDFTMKLHERSKSAVEATMMIYLKRAGDYLRGGDGEISMESLADYVKNMFANFSKLYDFESEVVIIKNKLSITFHKKEEKGNLKNNKKIPEECKPITVVVKVLPGTWDRFKNVFTLEKSIEYGHTPLQFAIKFG